MGLGETVLAVGAGERPASFEQFSAAIEPAWIAEALAATGTASVRRRKLPAEHVVWLVIGMGLFHDRSIAQVVQHLDLVLPTRNGGRGHVTNAAIVQARDQLGAAPLAALFAQTAAVWSTAAADTTRWRGLAVYGLDGTTLRVADTRENVAHFGRPGSRSGEGAGYPQLRLVALSVLRQHLVAAAALGPYRTSELTLAATLWAAVPDHALVILDRGFCSYALFHALADPARQRHWLVRAKTGRTALKVQVVQRLGPGDHVLDLTPSHGTRTAHRTLPATLRVRAVRVHHRGFRPYLVFTSLLELGTRTHLRRGQDAHPRARGGAAQSGPDPRRAGSVGLAARLQPPPPRDEPRRPARGRAAAAPELSSRAPRPARLLAHGLALAAWRPAASP